MTEHREWVTGQADYTGTGQLAHAEHDETLHLLADGDFGSSGVVALELKNPEGNFRSFPETELTTTGGKRVFLSKGQQWRLKITGCNSVNAEVR